jgi:uroporphyrinogen decarboxylase
MNGRERFRETMAYGSPDRVPYLEEGLRDDVIDAWRRQGLPEGIDPAGIFTFDRREEIATDLDPLPALRRWPTSAAELNTLEKRLDPADRRRLPEDWIALRQRLAAGQRIRMLRVHRGFFIAMGVGDWQRFETVMLLLTEKPAFVAEYMALYGRFAAALADRVLAQTRVEAALFSEPIGGNDGPLISPAMYTRFVLSSYAPLLAVLRRHRVETVVFRTYANARILIPHLLAAGFNCLWACEVNIDAMDYRRLRREFGRGLRFIGGIDLDVLRRGKAAIRRELEERVAPLVADGGYVPLADGRVRPDMPYDHYVYYRERLQALVHEAAGGEGGWRGS